MLKNSLPTLPLISLLSSDYLFFNTANTLLNSDLLQNNNFDILLQAVRHYYPNHYRLDEIELSLQDPILQESGIRYNEFTQSCTGSDYQFNFLNYLFDHFLTIKGSNIYAKNEYLDEYITLISKITPYQIIAFKLASLVVNDGFSLVDIQRFIHQMKPLGYKVKKSFHGGYAENHFHLKGASYAAFHLTELFLAETPIQLYAPDSLKKLPQLHCYPYINNKTYNLGQVIDITKLALTFVIDYVINTQKNVDYFIDYQQNLAMILNHQSALLTKQTTDLRSIFSYFQKIKQPITKRVNIENQLLNFALVELNNHRYIAFQLSIYSLLFYLEQKTQNIFLRKMIKLYIHGCNILRGYLLMSQNMGLAHFSEYSRGLLRKSDHNLQHILDTQKKVGTTWLNAKFSYPKKEQQIFEHLQTMRDIFREHDIAYTFCLCVSKKREKRIKLPYFSNAKPRHYKCRKDLEKKAKALDNILSHMQYKNLFPKIKEAKDLLQTDPNLYDLSQDIINIDAVGKETHTPVGVYAPYFRFLRRSPKKNGHHLLPMDCHPNQHSGLLICVHAGEDFNHLLTGLRAIDEAVLFYDMKRKDRLGHALALGINPKQWLKQTQAIMVTHEEWMDNLVWLFKTLMEMSAVQLVLGWFLEQLKCEIRSLFTELYPSHLHGAHLTDFIEAWKMRQICPFRYLDDKNGGHTFGEYGKATFSFFKLNKEAMAEQIYYAYMFDASVEEKGKKVKVIDSYAITPELLNLYEMVQDHLISRYAKLGLIIEANPSSNLFISNLNKYQYHPIFRFYPPKTQFLVAGQRFNQYKLRQGCIEVCVNSDDPAIFSTTLQNEFRLLKQCAIEYYDCGEKEAQQWIDELQLNGIRIFQENYANTK